MKSGKPNKPGGQRTGAFHRNVDGVIVLSGAELPELTESFGEPLLSSHGDRLTTFLSLAHRHVDARLVHAGGGAQVDYSQSDAARSVILGAGVEPSRVMFERRSRNTCESARLTQELVRPSPGENWLLVTSAFHMPRAVACFRTIDWEVTPYPTGFARGKDLFSFNLVDNLRDVDLATHEWIGLLYYRLRGFTEEVFPRPRS